MDFRIQPNRQRARTVIGGFSLLELLTASSIIAILASLVLIGVMNVSRRVKRTSCLNNLKQIGLGSLMYSNDDSKTSFSNTKSDGDDNQNWLFPTYVSTIKTFVCPATRNVVRLQSWRTNSTGSVESDLSHYAGDKYQPGSSYEVFGFMNFNGGSFTELTISNEVRTVAGIRKTQSSVDTYVHKSQAFRLSGTKPGPAAIWLFLDGDAKNAWNYPSSTGNHGEEGANVQFCDGHVEFVRRNDFVYRYELSQDESRTTP